MIDRSFIEKIEEMATKTEAIAVEGRFFSKTPLIPILDPTPKTLITSTLSSTEDYLRDNPDQHSFGEILIHVQSQTTVNIYSSLSPKWKSRDLFLSAVAAPPNFAYGNYLPVEQFIICLQAQFVQDETTAQILKIIGNLTDGKTTNFSDDGITQQVTAKAGIARVENMAVPNPVILAPYRTFLEVEQPASRFILRMKSQNDSPYIALFEGDGGGWQLKAKQSIKDWLVNHLPKEIVILT